ncbi:SubName: Full=Uncharacterized protein {ECO:0000313/EMBL:CCA74620.1} [Serendipita indica DSM 11827]|nr:SubName: Full=Uncharacterized protein {ECO:0000313/EMBL:CCA74620.1} [Serendipita indica DSM 11827]
MSGGFWKWSTRVTKGIKDTHHFKKIKARSTLRHRLWTLGHDQKCSSRIRRIGNAYLPRPAGTQPVGPQYTYEHDPSGPGQWSTEPTPGAVQTQSAYSISEGRTQFRHSATSENEIPRQPTTGGHFQPQLEPLANPDGALPFTHFRSSSGTDIANITGASPHGSTSSTGQLASARVPPPPVPTKLDANMTGGSVTSQTSATSATGAGVSSKLGPLTPSTHHQRDPHDERVLELLSLVATGTTTPVATASGQTCEGEAAESND